MRFFKVRHISDFDTFMSFLNLKLCCGKPGLCEANGEKLHFAWASDFILSSAMMQLFNINK